VQEEIRPRYGSEEIVGESPALKQVLAQAKKLALSDITVLLVGAAGSGKESVARAIHRVSTRRNESFVKVHCAIPGAELEGELFGYEKGAFDGTTHEKTSRLELANKGTLFLDEIAKLPLDLQPKLLRVLQRGEVERLGSTRTIRECALDCSDKARFKKSGGGKSAPRGFVPSIQHIPNPGSAAARKTRRYSATRALLRAEVCAPYEQTHRKHPS
jgi:Sigma-54 interaction domain